MERAVWVGEIGDTDLRSECGAITFERGLVYARSDRVVSLRESPDGRRLVALVRGSTRRQYQTILERFGENTRGGTVWHGQCSCPVSQYCKHVVAVVLTARAQLDRTDTNSWQHVFAPLLEPDPEPERGDAVGLEFALLPPSHREPARVRMRPMRQMARSREQRWTAQGASWNEIMGTGGAWARPNPFRADHRSLIAELYAMWQATSGTPAYSYGSAPTLHLDQFGVGLWSLLQRCVEAGVVVVPGAGLVEVAIGDQAGEVELDLTRPDGEAGPLQVAAVMHGNNVTLADADIPHDLVPIGRPAHGLAHLSRSVLTLVPLGSAPSQIAQNLLGRPPLRIPAEDVDQFLRFYGPRLRRHGSLRSSDEAVQIGPPPEPELLLTLTVLPDHHLTLTWEIGYPDNSGGHLRLPIERGPGDPPREHAAEEALIAGLTPIQRMPALIEPLDPPGRLRPTVTLRPAGTITLVTEVLPELHKHDKVRITIVGDLPGYGEAEGDPMVHLDARDGVDGDWFDLSVSVTVDGQDVPFEPLFSALARGDDTMMLLSGTWFSLRRPELDALRRLIDEGRHLADPQTRTVRLTPYQVGYWEDLVNLGVIREQSQRWKQAVEGLLSLGQADPAPAPDGLAATLRPYQQQGYQWLAHLWDAGLGGVLADDMGLGKTVQTLAVLLRSAERGDLDDAPAVVVAPASVVSTWVDEAARFCPDLKVTAVTSTANRRGTDLPTATAGAHVVVTSYTLLRLEAEAYRDLPWSALILDEAQFVKNHQAKTYRAARELGAARTFAITGTPLENSLMDLWAMLSLAAPGLYPRPEEFTERFRKPIERGYGGDQLATLRRRVRPFLLRRTKDLVAPELPAKQEQLVRVPLAPPHQRVYSRHLQRERQRVLGMLEDMQQNRMAIFRALTTLRQMSLDPSMVEEEYAGLATSAKIETLLTHVRELVAEGHRALVFSTFTEYLSRVRLSLDQAGIGYSYLDGSTRDRGKVIEGFRAGDDPLFLISLKAGGFGLTLTEADYVFLLDPWWNPAAEAQAIDRTHRIGQDKPVMVYRLVSTGTIEEKVIALQERKRDLFAQVVDGEEFRTAAITADDIRDLLG